MTDEQCLNDRCPEDRLNPRLDLTRMRQAKPEPDNRPSWAWCFAIAALVLGLLKFAGSL